MSVVDVLGDHKEKGKFKKDLQHFLHCSMSRRMPDSDSDLDSDSDSDSIFLTFLCLLTQAF